MVVPQARAILWAQVRTLWNFYGRGRNRGPALFTIAMSLLWYGLVAFGGWSLAVLLAAPARLEEARGAGSQGVFFSFLYWQLVPLMLGAAGAQLDLKRLVVYPVTAAQLSGWRRCSGSPPGWKY